MTWLLENWPMILSVLWALDNMMVSIFGHTTLIDSITNILKSLGGQPPANPPTLK